MLDKSGRESTRHRHRNLHLIPSTEPNQRASSSARVERLSTGYHGRESYSGYSRVRERETERRGFAAPTVEWTAGRSGATLTDLPRAPFVRSFESVVAEEKTSTSRVLFCPFLFCSVVAGRKEGKTARN